MADMLQPTATAQSVTSRLHRASDMHSILCSCSIHLDTAAPYALPGVAQHAAHTCANEPGSSSTVMGTSSSTLKLLM